MTRLSIVIPAVGSQQDVDNSLLSVLENRPDDCEIIVVHRPDYVDPYDLSDEVRFVISAAQDLVGMVDCGLAASRGEFLHTLHSGIMVETGWADAALEIFQSDRNVGSISPCCAVRAGDSRKSLLGIRFHPIWGRQLVVASTRSRVESLAPTVAGPHMIVGFYRTSALRMLGGWFAAYGAGADGELAQRLQRAGFHHRVATKCQTGPIPKYALSKPHGFHAARVNAQLYRAFLRGRQGQGAWRYPAHVLADVLRSCRSLAPISTLAGHLAGWVTSASNPCSPQPSAVGGEANASPHRPLVNDIRRDSIPAPHFAITAKNGSRLPSPNGGASAAGR